MPSAKLTKILNKTEWQYSETATDYQTLLYISLDIADVIDLPITKLEEITARDQYAEGEWTGDITYNEFELAQAVINGEIVVEELIYANNIITRYLKAAEKSGKKPEWMM